MKILIVDDEMKVCWLLEQIIQWGELQAECVGIAGNGLEALKQMERSKPDVIITDIRMPDMDGLELVRRVKEKNTECDFVMISGYQQFEYAHTAIKFGVEDFLLKPINRDEINASLKRISEKRTQKKELYSAFLKEQKDNKIKEWEMRAMLANLLRDDRISDYTHKHLAIEFPKGAWQCVGVRVDVRQGYHSTEEEDFFHSRARDIIKNELKEGMSCCAVYDRGFLLLILNGEDERRLKTLLFEEYCRVATEYLQAFEECTVTLALSNIQVRLEDLCAAAKQVKELLVMRVGFGGGRVMTSENTYKEIYPEVLFHPIEAKRYVNLLEMLEAQQLQETIKAGFRNVFEGETSQRSLSVHKTIIWIFEQYKEILGKKGFITKSELAEDLNMFELEWRNISDYSVLNHFPADRIEQRVSVYHARKEEMDSRPILLAKEYVDNHTDKDCSLQEVAEIVGLSPNYLSVVFSEEVGMTFKDYVTEAKIAKAKELLIVTDDKIKVIAEKVGYRDAKYFSRLFEKKVNLKPAQYRKIMH